MNSEKIKELRDKTRLSLRKCKQLLVDCSGDVDRAFELAKKEHHQRLIDSGLILIDYKRD